MTAETGRELQIIPPRGVARSFEPEAMLSDWRAHMAGLVAAGEMAAPTATTYARGMRRFLEWTGERQRVGPAIVREWKAAMLRDGAKPGTVNVHLAGVRAFFRWAVAEQGLAYDPTGGVKGASRRGQSRRHKRDPLTDREVLRVLAQPDTDSDTGKRDRALLTLMAYTGARSVEVARARVGDLRTAKHLTLEVQGKGRAEADESLALVHPELLEALYSWLAVHPRGDDTDAPLFCSLGNRNTGGPLALSTLRALVKGYYQAAGIRDGRKTTHSLRHSFVSNLTRQGVPPLKIMAATRHKSLDTLLVYAHEIERESDPAEAYVSYTQL